MRDRTRAVENRASALTTVVCAQAMASGQRTNSAADRRVRE